MNNKKNRYHYLDLVKIIAIYLVCFYHFAEINFDITTSNAMSTYINYFIKTLLSACVPLFFIVNGALILNKELDIYMHIKKTIRLFILTFIWGVILLSSYGVIMGDSYSVLGFIKSLVTWKEGRLNLLWYLQTLTCIYILFPIIKSVYDNKDKNILRYTAIIIVIFTFGISFLNMILDVIQILVLGGLKFDGLINLILDKFNPFKGFYAYSIVYFIMGGIIFQKIEDNTQKVSNTKLILFPITSALILFLYGVIVSLNTRNLCDISWNGYDSIMTLIISISIVIICFKLEYKIKNTKLLTVIGSNTLGIYLLHGIVGRFLKPFFISLPISGNLIFNIIYIFIFMMITLGIVLILKKIPLVKELFKLG